MSDDGVDEAEPAALAPDEAFSILGERTRLSILWALWEAYVPGAVPSEYAVPFEKLRRRVGVDDSGRFNYHVNRLADRFVERTDAGYVLRWRGHRMMQAVLAGTLTEDVVVEGALVGDACPLCGASIVVDYEDERFRIRCPACAGVVRSEHHPRGTLSLLDFPPAGMRNRTPNAAYRAESTWSTHRMRTLLAGVCPECAGTVSVTGRVCADHDAGRGEVCSACGSLFAVDYLHVCDICKFDFTAWAWVHVFTHPTVSAFYHERGYEYPPGPNYLRVWTETVEAVTVVAEDPLAVEVAVAIDDEHLLVRLDEDGTVVDVHRDR